MNCNVYFYIKTARDYSQYPDNYSRNIILRSGIDVAAKQKNVSHFTVCRNERLVYLTYQYRYADSKSFGICCEYNGVIPTDFKYLFDFYDELIMDIINKGEILHYDSSGHLCSSVNDILEKAGVLAHYSSYINNRIDVRRACFVDLPPQNYAMISNEPKVLEYTESTDVFLRALKTNLSVVVSRENPYVKGYNSVIARIVAERDEIIKQLNQKKEECSKLKVKQRNIKWVGLLGIIILILGVVLWNKVLFPSEVTRYETGEFVYYGPLDNKKPHGVGVAIYPNDDIDDRMYYIGRFVNGNRQDSTAILFYKNGDYFYGAMEGDKWIEGLFYSSSDGTYFKGSFKDDVPYNGEWFSHEKKCDLVDGEARYNEVFD